MGKSYQAEIPHGLMFHHFHDERHPRSPGSLSQGTFDQVLQFVGIQRILNPEEWLDRLDNGQLRESDLCLTFDDALRSQVDVALPVLEKYNLKAFWFVYSSVFEGSMERLELYARFRATHFGNIDQFYELFFDRVRLSGRTIEVPEAEITSIRSAHPFYSKNDVVFRLLRDRVLGKKVYEELMDGILADLGVDVSTLARNLWMSSPDLRYLADSGHLIGLHSYSHPTVLGSLSYADQLDEYRRNFLHLAEACGRKPLAMSHPCNSYNAITIGILKELGIRCGFRSNMRPPDAVGRLNPSLYEIAREDHANVFAILDT